ncbi:hypothetical protein D9611_006782 [Ephemerocybe angulata]|uniref:Uncharacterized protein n=1 Tax=Ephemerocybe angulata TaxID=980116 RepID=A0A8H5B0A0_9AGAR|nr:hypothetical protein D9611_006782 [Tulosesus angulatus]
MSSLTPTSASLPPSSSSSAVATSTTDTVSLPSNTGSDTSTTVPEVPTTFSSTTAATDEISTPPSSSTPTVDPSPSSSANPSPTFSSTTTSISSPTTTDPPSSPSTTDSSSSTATSPPPLTRPPPVNEAPGTTIEPSTITTTSGSSTGTSATVSTSGSSTTIASSTSISSSSQTSSTDSPETSSPLPSQTTTGTDSESMTCSLIDRIFDPVYCSIDEFISSDVIVHDEDPNGWGGRPDRALHFRDYFLFVFFVFINTHHDQHLELNQHQADFDSRTRNLGVYLHSYLNFFNDNEGINACADAVAAVVIVIDEGIVHHNFGNPRENNVLTVLVFFTTVRSQTQTTTSTTLTVTPESTFRTPVAVVSTNSLDGSLFTTTPPYVTIYSTRTEADGSIATETHIVANPPPGSYERSQENPGVLSRTGAAAGIFASVGVFITALGFILYLLWRRRKQSNVRKRWMAGMRQQRPDSFGGYPFERDPPPASAAGGSDRGHGHSDSRAGFLPPPALPFGDSDDDLPWGESRRIPEQRAEMRQKGTAVPVTCMGGAGYSHGHGTGVDQADIAGQNLSDSSAGGVARSSFQQGVNSGSVNRNPFSGGILGLNRSGSNSTASSSTSNIRKQHRTSASMGKAVAIDKNRISLPVPVAAPVRKPAVYPDDDPFSDRMGLSPITERTSVAPTVTSTGNFNLNSTVLPASPPPIPTSNWAHRQQISYAYSPAPSTPSMYPPTLPADDEMDETGEFDSDATMDRYLQLPEPVAITTTDADATAERRRSVYDEVDGYSAFQNLFVMPNRPKPSAPPPPALVRVPPQPLSINTSITTSAGNRGSAATSPVPPRPPRSILRTSNGSLSLGPARVRVQSSAEFIPLTPPASTPGHSPNTSYSSPNMGVGGPGLAGIGAGMKTQGSMPNLTMQQQFASPPESPVVLQDKVQELLSNRRMLLDRRLDGGAPSRVAREGGLSSGSE